MVALTPEGFSTGTLLDQRMLRNGMTSWPGCGQRKVSLGAAV